MGKKRKKLVKKCGKKERVKNIIKRHMNPERVENCVKKEIMNKFLNQKK